MIEQQHKTFNPFLSVWLYPKKTARYVVENKNISYVLLVLAIGYIGVFSSSLIDSELYPLLPVWGILLLLIILSPILAMISNALYALFIWAIAKIFNGVGSYQETFKGLALTAIPEIILIPFYIVWMVADPYSFFQPDVEGTLTIAIFSIIIALLTVTVSIWCIVLSIAIIAEIHSLSNWKAFFVLLITAVVFFILFVIILFILVLGFLGVSYFIF